MLTEKDYCDYDTCVALKELGYKVPTSAYYMPNNKQLIFIINQFRGGAAMDCFFSNNSLPKECMASDLIDAPTMWEAQKWLREEKEICVEVLAYPAGYIWSLCHAYNPNNIFGGILIKRKGVYETHEEALLEGVRASIKLLKEENKKRKV